MLNIKVFTEIVRVRKNWRCLSIDSATQQGIIWISLSFPYPYKWQQGPSLPSTTLYMVLFYLMNINLCNKPRYLKHKGMSEENQLFAFLKPLHLYNILAFIRKNWHVIKKTNPRCWPAVLSSFMPIRHYLPTLPHELDTDNQFWKQKTWTCKIPFAVSKKLLPYLQWYLEISGRKVQGK